MFMRYSILFFAYINIFVSLKDKIKENRTHKQICFIFFTTQQLDDCYNSCFFLNNVYPYILGYTYNSIVSSLRFLITLFFILPSPFYRHIQTQCKDINKALVLFSKCSSCFCCFFFFSFFATSPITPDVFISFLSVRTTNTISMENDAI